MPFQQIGTPWLAADVLADFLKELGSIKTKVVGFTPEYSKYKGEFCQGICIQIQSPKSFNPVVFAEQLLCKIALQHPTQIEFLQAKDGRYFIDLL